MSQPHKSILEQMSDMVSAMRDQKPVKQPVFYVSFASVMKHAKANAPELAARWELLDEEEQDAEIADYMRKLLGNVAIKNVEFPA